MTLGGAETHIPVANWLLTADGLSIHTQKAQQEVQEAATRTATARLPRPPSTAQQQQRLKNNTIARLEADLAASKARIDQVPATHLSTNQKCKPNCPSLR
jgi:hypothetical protein